MSADAPPASARAALFEPLPAPAWYSPAAIALAAGAAVLLVGRPAGLGVTLLLWALGAAAAAIGRPDRWAAVWWAAFGVLAAVPSVRSAGWVLVISLLGAGALASLAVAGGATWREVVRGASAWLVNLVPGPLVVVAHAGRRRWGGLAPLARGAILAVVLVWVFGALFAAADAAFAELVEDTFGWVEGFDDNVAGRVGLAIAVVAIAGSLLRSAHPTASALRSRAPRLGRVEWLIALAALNALFAGFVLVQLTTLFGGQEFVLRTAGLSYAEYAREGFGQLVAVAALTLALIAAARNDDPLVRLLLGGLAVLTLVVLASALKRLGLYEEAYGFTRLRMLAHAAILWMGVVFVALLAAGAARHEAWLPRACVAITAAFLVGFAASNPDLRIARENLTRGGPVDTRYLRGLSADAAPALGTCEPARGGLLAWNLGRSRAGC